MSHTIHKDYSSPYESWLTLKNGKKVFLRPILKTDERLIVDLFSRLHPDDIYLRFLRPLNALPDDLLFQLIHIDYNKSFALVAVTPENGNNSIIAVVRYGYDPVENVTDFAVIVRDDWQHNGLGKSLLSKIFAIGKQHGISCFVSIIDSTNYIIKQILRKIGYRVKYSYRNGSIQVEVCV